MTLLLGILAGVWALFLVPPYLRRRQEHSADTIVSFHQQLSILGRTRPGFRSMTGGSAPVLPMSVRPIPMGTGSGMPSGRAEARRRRRDILLTLGGAVAITLLLAVVLGGAAILCNLLADALLGAYMYLLVQVRKSEAERVAKVRYLPTPAASPEPALLLQRTASR